GAAQVGEFELSAEELLIDASAPEGMAAAEDGGYLVAFDTALTPKLLAEGLARDLVRGIQEGRKAADFEVSDRIRLSLELDAESEAAAKTWQDFIAGEVLAVEVNYVSTPV